MPALQLPALAILVVWVAIRLQRAPRPRATATRLSALTAAAWLVEQSMIRAHGYHFYSDAWWLFIGHVPLLVVLAWPVLIDAAWSCAEVLASGRWSRVMLCALLVGVDVAIVQPLGVHTGLVRWNATGPLGVPPIALFGPAIFAGAAARLCLTDEDPKIAGALADALAAVGAAHLGVLVTWYAGLGRLEQTAGSLPLVATTMVLGFVGAIAALRRRAALPPGLAGVRAIAAVLFFLAAIVGRAPLVLWLWAAALALPWLGLTAGDRFAARSRWSR